MKKINFSKRLIRQIIASVSLLLALIVIVILSIYVLIPIFEFISKNQYDELRTYFDGFGWFGRIMFVGLAAVQVVLAVIPGGPVQIAAGSIYGTIEGFVLSIIGIEIGSLIAFLLVKKFGLKTIEVFLPSDKFEKFKFLMNEKFTKKQINSRCLGLFFIPGSPKDLLAYVFGLTSIKTKDFVIITTIARIPFVLISTISGASIMKNPVYVTVIIFVVISIICIVSLLLYKNYFTKHMKKDFKNNNAENTKTDL